MQKDIHPKYSKVQVSCSCGNSFNVASTLNKEVLHLEICANCHPIYSGKQKAMGTAGTIDRFHKKYANRGKK